MPCLRAKPAAAPVQLPSPSLAALAGGPNNCSLISGAVRVTPVMSAARRRGVANHEACSKTKPRSFKPRAIPSQSACPISAKGPAGNSSVPSSNNREAVVSELILGSPMLVHAGRRLLEESRALRVRRSTL